MTHISIDGWVDKENVVYIYNEFTLKGEGNSDTCHNMDELWEHYAKWNKPITKGQILSGSIYIRFLV